MPGSLSLAQGRFDMERTVDQTANLQITGRMLSLLQPVFIVYLVRGSTRGDRSNYDRWIGRRHATLYKGQLCLLMEKAGVDD